MSKLDWQRFWCPVGSKVPLDPQGYLPDLSLPGAEYWLPETKTIDALERYPCLVLLGEPGIGKSTAIGGDTCGTSDSKDTKTGDFTLHRDLKAYQTDFSLIRGVFENPTFRQWSNSDSVLTLVLDSFDECRIRIDTVASLLFEELRQKPIKRLRLRVACRTAEWPAHLTDDLQRLWGKDEVGVFELLPLRKRDVEQAAQAEAVNAEEFIAEVERCGAAPFAIKPVSLFFLLRTYKQRRSLPSRQCELYLEGCRLLADEPSQNRRSSPLFRERL
jgi:predicted NACHT family NTPase